MKESEVWSNVFLNTKLKLEKLLVIIILKTVIPIKVLRLCLGAVTITPWTLFYGFLYGSCINFLVISNIKLKS